MLHVDNARSVASLRSIAIDIETASLAWRNHARSERYREAHARK